jgi:hypothetical protein
MALRIAAAGLAFGYRHAKKTREIIASARFVSPSARYDRYAARS